MPSRLLVFVAVAFMSGLSWAQPRFIAVESGSDQYAGGVSFPTTFLTPLRAKVTTESGAPVAGAQVVFTVTSLDGAVRVEGGPEFRAVTDSQGIASVGPLRGLAGIGYFNMVANTESPVPRPAVFILSQNPSPLCVLPVTPAQTYVSIESVGEMAAGNLVRVTGLARVGNLGVAPLQDGQASLFDGDTVIGTSEIVPADPGRAQWDVHLPIGTTIFRARVLGGCDRLRSVSAPVVHVTRGDVQPAWNLTDMWWKPAESGWGMSMIQHATGQLFAVWFHYSETGSPQWLVIPGGAWTTPTSFTGAIYRTTGPALGGVFDPSRVTVVPVGVATLAFADADHGTFAWWMDNGAQGIRSITRQPF
jgi:hypothetical protein